MSLFAAEDRRNDLKFLLVSAWTTFTKLMSEVFSVCCIMNICT